MSLVSGRLLVVETPIGLYLPGGGLIASETAEQALRREVREETGYHVATIAWLGRAGQYVGMRTNKIEDYFTVEVTGMMSPAPEPVQGPCWVGVESALAGLAEEAQAWAVRSATRAERP